MIFLNILSIFFIGIISIIQDFKYNKIKNQTILFGLILGIILNVILITENFSKILMLKIITNLFFSIIVSFYIWDKGFWNAGDGKLFIILSLLIPITSYENSIPWIESSTFIFNISFITIIYMLFLTLKQNTINKNTFYNNIIQNISKKLINKVMIKNITAFLINSFKTLLRIYILIVLLEYIINYNFVIIILKIIAVIYILKLCEKYLKNKDIIPNIIIILLLTFLFNKAIDFQTIIIVLKTFILWKIFALIYNSGIVELSEKKFNKEILVKNLKKGDILSNKYEIICDLNENKIEKLSKNKDFDFFASDDFGILIHKFKKAHTQNLVDDIILKKIKSLNLKKISISQKIQFSNILFLSAIITILFNQNLFILIKIFLF